MGSFMKLMRLVLGDGCAIRGEGFSESITSGKAVSFES